MSVKATEKLIEGLSQGLAPVRPLRPPFVRSLLWLGAALVCVGAVLIRWANLDLFMARTSDARLALESTAALLTGITAVIAAFYLSVPDRSSLWRYAPLPPLALWMATSSLGCLQYGFGWGPPGHRLGESLHCFRFILLVSVPLAIMLYVVLRRARPLQPLPVALSAALGVAALAAFALEFFHPFDSTVVDLSMHGAAVLLVLALAGLSRRVLA